MKAQSVVRALAAVYFPVHCATALAADPLNEWHLRNFWPPDSVASRDQADQTPSLSDFALYDITYGNGTFVAVGWAWNAPRSVILTSRDGTDWNSPVLRSEAELSAIAFGSNTFVAINRDGTLTSSNGIDWASHSSGDRFEAFCSASYINGSFFVATRGLLSSPDGIVWTPRYAHSNHVIQDVTYGNGLYVAVGWEEQNFAGQVISYAGLILTSTNGENWSAQNQSRAYFLNEVAYGNGLFVASGSIPGTIITSSNGLDWVERHLSLDYLGAAGYGGGAYVVAGSGPIHVEVLTSRDGNNWTRSTLSDEIANALQDLTLSAVAYGGGTFVAVGSRGAILQSGNLAIPRLEMERTAASSQVALKLSGELGRTYRVQSCSNLAPSAWTDFLPVTLDQTSATIPVTVPPNAPRRFYRAVSP